jgi:hypothetical protein
MENRNFGDIAFPLFGVGSLVAIFLMGIFVVRPAEKEVEAAELRLTSCNEALDTANWLLVQFVGALAVSLEGGTTSATLAVLGDTEAAEDEYFRLYELCTGKAVE